MSLTHADRCPNCGRAQMPRKTGQTVTARICQSCEFVEEIKEPLKLNEPKATLAEPKPTLVSEGYAPGLRYRAVLKDGDETRERPLVIYGNGLAQIEQWAALVLKQAPDGAVVNVYQSIEQHIKILAKAKVGEATKQP
jgi:hypothetical protein